MIVVRPKYTPEEKVYLIEILRGLGVTIRHFLRNFLGVFGFKKNLETWEYPEEPHPDGGYNPRNRLIHRLTRRPDGSPKCVACYMCATACPADAIEIIAEESPDPEVEKRPASFVIDELRCVFCGFCVEACPEDAIRMDTVIGDLVASHRLELVYDLDKLLNMPPRPNAITYDREEKAKKEAGLFMEPPGEKYRHSGH